jgi:hypothetical protein
MSGSTAVHPGPTEAPPPRALTLVWIDAREALMVRWDSRVSQVVRIASDVPARHRSTGHVRHDPHVRHGGGGPPQSAGEPHRLEHLARFLERVADALPADDDLLILGPGTVRERLARLVREQDRRHRVARVVSCVSAPPLTRPQLDERLRRAAGDEPRRRTVGAYRWTERRMREACGSRPVEPRRVVAKPPARPRGPEED